MLCYLNKYISYLFREARHFLAPGDDTSDVVARMTPEEDAGISTVPVVEFIRVLLHTLVRVQCRTKFLQLRGVQERSAKIDGQTLNACCNLSFIFPYRFKSLCLYIS